MPVLYDIRGQIVKFDRQILDLLEARMRVCREMREAGEGVEDEDEVLDRWAEGAMERGLDDTGGIERVCRTVVSFCRKAGGGEG